MHREGCQQLATAAVSSSGTSVPTAGGGPRPQPASATVAVSSSGALDACSASNPTPTSGRERRRDWATVAVSSSGALDASSASTPTLTNPEASATVAVSSSGALDACSSSIPTPTTLGALAVAARTLYTGKYIVCVRALSITYSPFPTASRPNTGTNTNKTYTSKMQDHSMAACSPNRLDTTGGVAAAMKWSWRWSACP